MAKNDTKFNRKKVEKKNCENDLNCNVSALTDSVEFANEPFDNSSVNKCASDSCDDNCDGGGC